MNDDVSANGMLLWKENDKMEERMENCNSIKNRIRRLVINRIKDGNGKLSLERKK